MWAGNSGSACSKGSSHFSARGMHSKTQPTLQGSYGLFLIIKHRCTHATPTTVIGWEEIFQCLLSTLCYNRAINFLTVALGRKVWTSHLRSVLWWRLRSQTRNRDWTYWVGRTHQTALCPDPACRRTTPHKCRGKRRGPRTLSWRTPMKQKESKSFPVGKHSEGAQADLKRPDWIMEML